MCLKDEFNKKITHVLNTYIDKSTHKHVTVFALDERFDVIDTSIDSIN